MDRWPIMPRAGLLLPMALLVVGAAAARGQAPQIVAEQSVAPRIPVHVAPGAEVIKTIVVHNQGQVAVDHVRLRAGLPRTHMPGAAPFQTLDPDRCSDMTEVVVSTGALVFWSHQIDLPDLAAGERRTCRYRYRRDSESSRDLLLFWHVVEPADNDVPPGTGALYAVGDLADLNLSVAPTCQGGLATGQVQARVSVTNNGPTTVDSQRFGTCLHNFLPVFSIDGEFEGGCGPNAGAPGACFGGAGVGWAVPALAAGQSHHCELRLTELPEQPGVRALPIRLQEPYYATDTQHLVWDIDPGTAMSVLDFDALSSACQGSGGAPRPVPLMPLWALLTLAGGLLVLAAWRRLRGGDRTRLPPTR